MRHSQFRHLYFYVLQVFTVLKVGVGQY